MRGLARGPQLWGMTCESTVRLHRSTHILHQFRTITWRSGPSKRVYFSKKYSYESYEQICIVRPVDRRRGCPGQRVCRTPSCLCPGPAARCCLQFTAARGAGSSARPIRCSHRGCPGGRASTGAPGSARGRSTAARSASGGDPAFAWSCLRLDAGILVLGCRGVGLGRWQVCGSTASARGVGGTAMGEAWPRLCLGERLLAVKRPRTVGALRQQSKFNKCQ
jgi:hypothetical protein